MKCPVCEKRIEITVQKCPNCGFEDLRTEFINEKELEMWRTYVVYPCKFAYQTSIAQTKDLERKFKKELSEIKKAQTERQESGGLTNSEPPAFKKPALQKDAGWRTEKNITYKTLYECTRHGGLTKCEITNMIFDFLGNKVTANFFVKKSYDRDGSDSTTSVGFKWKLKDDYGIVVADGEYFNDKLQLGDITKTSISISGLSSSTKYILELVNC